MTSYATDNQAMINRLDVDQERLLIHVKTLSIDYFPRSYKHINNLTQTADYIRQQWLDLGLDVTEQVYSVGDNDYKNIITHIGPESGAKIVVGAHYDVAGDLPGADDNASGIAGLIELARLLSQHPLKKKITLVAYTLEEPPFFGTEAMGSFVHAKSELEQGSDIDLMISLEMIGYYTDKPDSQDYPVFFLHWMYPDTGNFIGVVDRVFSGWGGKMKKAMSQYMTLPVHSINAPSVLPGIDFSDHRNYWAHGYDAVMITDTAFYRNKAYHTELDTYDRLDYQKMGEVVKGVYGFLKSLENQTKDITQTDEQEIE